MPICEQSAPPLQRGRAGHVSRCWLTPRRGDSAVGRRRRRPRQCRGRAVAVAASRLASAADEPARSEWADRTRPSAPAPDASPAAARDVRGRRRRLLVRVEDLVQVLPDPRRPPRRRPDRRRPGRRRRQLRRPPRRDARPGGRVRLRQDDARPVRAPARPPSAPTGRATSSSAGTGPVAGLDGDAAAKDAARSMQIIFQDPYGSLNPRMPVGDIVGEGLLVHGHDRTRSEREERVGELLDDGGPEPEPHPRYPHEFSRRPAPAHRHRPGPRPEPGVHRLRRARLRARRLDPEPDPQPARRPPAGAGPHLPVHRPQPGGRRVHQRPGRRHVPGQDGRAGRRRRDLRPPAATPTRSPCCRRSRTRIRASQEADHPQGRRPVAGQPAVRLPVPHALLAARAAGQPRELLHGGRRSSARSRRGTRSPAISPTRSRRRPSHLASRSAST